MPRRILLLICIVVFATTTALESASGQYPQSKPAAAQIEGRKQVEASNPKSEEQDEPIAAMKADLQRMRVILNQMRTNLAFVQNTATPLKHQFELENEMWQVVLDRMDRRIQEMERSRGAKPER
jgi:hypothetical protein